MNIKPLGDKVILEPIKIEEKTKSGIVLPDTAEKEKPEQGKVVAVGEGKVVDGIRYKPHIKEGETVLFKKYSADEFKMDDRELLVVSEEDIIGVIEN